MVYYSTHFQQWKLAENLILKPPKPPNNFGMESVYYYYKKYHLKEKLIFADIQSDKVFKILKIFDETEASGIDDLSGIFLKYGAKLLTTPITQLCNLSISSRIYPDACKIAKLKSIFKKGTRRDPKNYRPISPLPLKSKVLERVKHKQTTEFLDKHKILFKFQSRFRKNHSTDFCLSYLTDKISNGFNSGLLTGMILIGLQNAFNTIDHYILLQKLPTLGFLNEVIDWFRSYLRSRKFRGNAHDKCSTTAKLRCGVSQRSILGPLVFLLYINDMPQAVDCDLFLYTDDTCLLYQQKNLDRINKELINPFVPNAPFLYPQKTENPKVF